MNIRDAKQEVIHTILAYTAKNEWGGYEIPPLRQRPLLLIGPPGIGKTAIMEQAAAACGIGFVSYTMTHHTRQSAIGLPFIEREVFDGRECAVTEYTMSEIIASVLHCIRDSGCREGLLFLDEINCVSETLAPAMLQFLQNKTFGNHRLPDGWVLAAAGNPQEYNKSVREFDIATLDRLKYIEVESDYDAWRPYALERNVHGAIISYLDMHRDSFYVLEQTYTKCSFATARGWEDLSCLLFQYERLQLPVTPDLVGQYLHVSELAHDFSGYYQLFEAHKKVLPVPAMLEGDEAAADICHKIVSESPLDEKLFLVHLMLSYLGGCLQEQASAARQAKLQTDLLDRLQRFQKQQRIAELSDAMSEFLKKEREVLAVRKEHGLSSEREIQEMQQALYALQTSFYTYQANQCEHTINQSISGEDRKLHGEIRNAVLERDRELTQSAAHLLDVTERGVALLSESDGPEFTLFLSSLFQNPLACEFFRKNPSPLCEQYRKRLDLQTREKELREKLLNNDRKK